MTNRVSVEIPEEVKKLLVNDNYDLMERIWKDYTERVNSPPEIVTASCATPRIKTSGFRKKANNKRYENIRK